MRQSDLKKDASAMIDVINDFAARWAEYFGWAVVQNTIFLGIIILLLRFLRDTPARIRYWIGLAGLVKLIIPPYMAAPFLKPDPIILSSIGTLSTRIFPALNSSEMPPPPPPTSVRLDLAGILFIAWFVFLAIFLLWPLLASWRMHRQLASATPVTDFEADGIPILKSDRINVPITFGLLRERIYVPDMWDDWSFETRTLFLKHEIAHIRRKDGLNRFFQILVQAIYFFHPLVWYVSRKMNEFREMACDDLSTGSKKTQSVEFSRALVQIAENLVQSRVDCPSASALIRQKNELLTRVQYQMEDTMKSLSKKRTALILAGLLILTVPLSWMKAKPAVEEPPPPPPPITGKIFGKVIDPEGNSLPGTNIVLRGTTMGAAAGMNGEYYIINVPPGIYTLAASRIGRKSVVFNDVKVTVNKSTEVNFKLEEALLDMTQGVPVTPKTTDKHETHLISLPKGGLEAIQQNLKYPKAAKNADLEGKVTVKVHYTHEGLKDAEIIESSFEKGKDLGCHQAALDAVKNAEWSRIKGAEEAGGHIDIPLVFSLTSPPPPDPDDEKVVFVPFDEPPVPIGGIEAIVKAVKLPEEAKDDKGRVIVLVQVDENGDVIRTRVTEPMDRQSVNDAVVEAVKNSKWKPAQQRDLKVKVWVAVPININWDSKLGKIGTKKMTPELRSHITFICEEIQKLYQKPDKDFSGTKSITALNVQINTKGQLTSFEITDSSGDKVYDQAAMKAAQQVNAPKIELKSYEEFMTVVDLGLPAPPPPNSSEENIQFVAYDEPPVPIGGFEAIQEKVVYPAIARKAGVEGRVLVYAKIDTHGTVQDTRVIQSLGPNGCNEAAITAIKSVQWKPASQRNRKVAVWIAVPVDFKNTKAEKKADKQRSFSQHIEWLVSEINKQYVKPDAEFKGSEKFTAIRVQMNERGHLTSVDMHRSCGDPAYDEAATSAVTRVENRDIQPRLDGYKMFVMMVDLGVGGNSEDVQKWHATQFQSSAVKPNTGKLWGWVSDAKGEPLPGTNVTVEGTTFGAATDQNGMYKIINLNPGIYTLKTARIGFQTIMNNRAIVKVNDSTQIDFKLKTTALKNSERAPGNPQDTETEPRIDLMGQSPNSQTDLPFTSYNNAPRPVGGMAAIQEKASYPHMARLARVEGEVVIHAYIGKDGEVIETRIAKDLGKSGLGKVAAEAVESVDWKPARQQDQNVDAWVAVPVTFALYE